MAELLVLAAIFTVGAVAGYALGSWILAAWRARQVLPRRTVDWRQQERERRAEESRRAHEAWQADYDRARGVPTADVLDGGYMATLGRTSHTSNTHMGSYSSNADWSPYYSWLARHETQLGPEAHQSVSTCRSCPQDAGRQEETGPHETGPLGRPETVATSSHRLAASPGAQAYHLRSCRRQRQSAG